MTNPKYVPELNCFLRRWHSLNGVKELKAVLLHSGGRFTGKIHFRNATNVFLNFPGEERGWMIEHGKESAVVSLTRRIGKPPVLTLSNLFLKTEIPDYW